MIRTFVMLILICSPLILIAQQQTETNVDKEGNKEVIDAAVGVTVTDKLGKVVKHQTAAEMNSFCNELDDPLVLAALRRDDSAEWAASSEICEQWGEVQPKTHIERMPFSKLIARLLLVAPPSSTFTRYRGMELKSGATSGIYDATILPNDLGYEPSCMVEEENRHEEGMLYTYQCSVKTESFRAALALRNHLAQTLEALHVTQEDEVREHGLAANARAQGYCAPSGECLEGNIYVTAMKDWKIVEIDPHPIFTRNTIAEMKAMQSGTHAPINGIATDSASLTFYVISVGSGKTADR